MLLWPLSQIHCHLLVFSQEGYILQLLLLLLIYLGGNAYLCPVSYVSDASPCYLSSFLFDQNTPEDFDYGKSVFFVEF